jgi:hypothetical protein
MGVDSCFSKMTSFWKELSKINDPGTKLKLLCSICLCKKNRFVIFGTGHICKKLTVEFWNLENIFEIDREFLMSKAGHPLFSQILDPPL